MRMDWPALKAARRRLHGLPAARRSATKTVFGVGDENADWMFVGEGPGRGGRRAGRAVRRPGRASCSTTCSPAIGLKRGENVYIANCVKCRPPGNRNPEPGEALAVRAVPAPPDRADPAEADRRAGQGRGGQPARDATRASRACAAGCSTTAARRSSSPTIRRTCCAASPTRRRRGRICASRSETMKGLQSGGRAPHISAA